MKNKAFVLICLLTCLYVSGCYQWALRKITINTEPANAKVWQIDPVTQNSIFLGMTPVKEQSVKVLEGFSYTGKSPEDRQLLSSKIGMVHVKIQKDGHKEYEGNLATNPDFTARHTITLEKQ